MNAPASRTRGTVGHPRRGFTLIEMLVAIALTIFIMFILAHAFSTGLETFRQLKGLGDMQAFIRMASLRLEVDLRASHFEDARRLSDPNFASVDPSTGLLVLPREGFFRLE